MFVLELCVSNSSSHFVLTFSAFFPSNWPVEIITESSNLLCQRSLLTYGTVLTDYTFEKTEGDFFLVDMFPGLEISCEIFFFQFVVYYSFHKGAAPD